MSLAELFGKLTPRGRRGVAQLATLMRAGRLHGERPPAWTAPATTRCGTKPTTKPKRPRPAAARAARLADLRRRLRDVRRWLDELDREVA